MTRLTLINQRTLIERAILDTLRLAFLKRQTVADLAALAALDVSAGYDGALCYVTSESRVYSLSMYSGAANAPPAIVAPTTPPARGPGARWIRSTSAVNWGPNSGAPLAARSAGFCLEVDFFRGRGGTDEGMLKVLAAKPSILLVWESSKTNPASSGYPGAYYEFVHTYSVWAISENDRGGPWSSWGDPVNGDVGANEMSAQIEYLMAGLHGSEAGAPRGNLGLQGLLWCEIGDTVNVDENLMERRFINATEVRVLCRIPVPDEDLVAIPPGVIRVQPRLEDTGAARTFDSSNYVTQGYQLAAGPGLTRSWGAGVAVVNGTPVSSTPAPVTFAAERDTYRDLKPDGTFVYQAVIRGGVPPVLSAGAMRVGVTTTDSTSIVQDKVLCATSILFRDTYQVVPPL